MKTKIFFLIVLLFTLFSCTEEGPFIMGKLECEIQVSKVTPSSAFLSVKFQDNNDNLANLYNYEVGVSLSKTPISNIQEYEENRESLIAGNFFNKEKDNYFFTGLQPNTKYYVVTEIKMYYNGEAKDNNGGYEYEVYCPGYAFTTAQEGDYSNLGEATCELVGVTENETIVKFNLPDGIEFPNGQTGNHAGDLNAVRAYASTSPDMSNAIESLLRVSFSDADIAEFAFKGLEKEKYYFQLRGSFYSSLIGSGFFGNYVHGDYVWKNITINVDNTLDFNVEEMSVKVESDFIGGNFSVFCINLPTNHSEYNISSVLWSSDGKNYSNKCSFSIEGSNCYVSIQQIFQTGDQISFRIPKMQALNTSSGKKVFIDLFGDVNFDISQSLNPLPTVGVIFDGIDYVLLKAKLPEILKGDSNHYDFQISRYSSFSESWTGKNCDDYLLLYREGYKELYLRLYGIFDLYGISINGYINFESLVPQPTEKQRLIDIKSELLEGELKISFSCQNNFSFEIVDKSVLEIWDYNDWSKVKFTLQPKLSASNHELSFGLTSDQTKDVKTDSRYCLMLKNVNIKYGNFLFPLGYDDLIDYNNGYIDRNWQWIWDN